MKMMINLKDGFRNVKDSHRNNQSPYSPQLVVRKNVHTLALNVSRLEVSRDKEKPTQQKQKLQGLRVNDDGKAKIVN